MVKGNIKYDEDEGNDLAARKERQLFSYLVNDVLFNPGTKPITAPTKH